MFSRQFGMRFYRAVVEHPGWWVGGWLALLVVDRRWVRATSPVFETAPDSCPTNA